MSDPDYPHADVVLCPNGPMLLRGVHTVIDETGRHHPVSRPVSAVCRCGHTATTPWCDGTHKVLEARRPTNRSASDKS